MKKMMLRSAITWAFLFTLQIRESVEAKTRGLIYDRADRGLGPPLQLSMSFPISQSCTTYGKSGGKKGKSSTSNDDKKSTKKSKSKDEKSKSPKAQKTKTSGKKSKKDSKVSMPECEEYCHMLDDYPFPNATYVVSLTLSILDTPLATEQALDEFFSNDVAQSLAICHNISDEEDRRLTSLQYSRRLEEGTILAIEVDAMYSDETTCEFEDDSLEGDCAQFSIYNEVTYDLGQPDQFEEEIYEGIVAQCEAIRALEEVETAFDPCPFITVTYMPSDGDDADDGNDLGIIGGNLGGSVGGDDGGDAINGDGDGNTDGGDGSGSGVTDPTTSTTDSTTATVTTTATTTTGGDNLSVIDVNDGTRENGGGDDARTQVGAGDDTEATEDKSVAGIGETIEANNDDERSLALGFGIGGFVIALLLCLCCLWACLGRRQKEHKELIDEDGDEDHANDADTLRDETTIDSSSPGRPGIRSDFEASIISDDEESPSSVRNPQPPLFSNLDELNGSDKKAFHDVHKCTSAMCSLCNPSAATGTSHMTQFVKIASSTPPKRTSSESKDMQRDYFMSDIVSL